MKIQNRINAINGINSTHWDSQRNRLIVYYSRPLDEMKIMVASAIADANLQGAIDTITFIKEGK